MKIGILGGTFNPIHYGHLRAAEEVREKLEFDKILFVPSGSPPLKTKEVVEVIHRYRMTRLAIVTNRFFELSNIECVKQGKSYTINTIAELKKTNPGINFSFILGIDAFLDITNWWKTERLIRLTDFVIISRPDYKFSDLKASPYIRISIKILKELDTSRIGKYSTKLNDSNVTFLRLTPIGISSTEIRRLIGFGKSIKYMLPAEVESYIIANKIYENMK